MGALPNIETHHLSLRWVELTWNEHGDGRWVGAWQYILPQHSLFNCQEEEVIAP